MRPHKQYIAEVQNQNYKAFGFKLIVECSVLDMRVLSSQDKKLDQINQVIDGFHLMSSQPLFAHRTKEEKVFQEFDTIIMQNMSHNLLLF